MSNDLHNKYKKRNTPLRKGDIVKILRGQFKKRTGKVDKILTKHQRVIIEGITLTKKNGTTTPYHLHPSNLMITELNLEDKKRIKHLERKHP
nr:50S ribosomal protein L24P [uncultured archaeon]